MPHHVSKARFSELVEQALAELPAAFAEALEEVSIEIRDHPTHQQLKKLGLRGRDLLLGLYEGRPRTQRSVEDAWRLPDVIYIFQEHVEMVSRNEADLLKQVRTTVLHEIGHHFGMDEDDLDELGYG